MSEKNMNIITSNRVTAAVTAEIAHLARLANALAQEGRNHEAEEARLSAWILIDLITSHNNPIINKTTKSNDNHKI